MQMFAKFSPLFIFAVASTTALASGTLDAKNFVRTGCNSYGVCAGQIFLKGTSATNLCDSDTMTIAWRKTQGTMLMVCNSKDTAEDNNAYVVSKSSVVGLNFGRYVDMVAIASNPNIEIPDQFSSKPLCAPASMEKLNSSDFLLLNKVPRNGSYCYDVAYLKVKDNSPLQIEIENKYVKPGDSDFYSGKLKQEKIKSARKIFTSVLPVEQEKNSD
ncbi:hypothetical protein LFL96_05025 [Paraburkholderia sp. D15]|uniref:hypothetical protein n=1 Tax=Paraburkholderia sp. D15 TaxID=2880218 RepID=UPI00247B1498|nr:hypothetical protein [Paraburkholderia sp. D15]WGS50869.1 hypothetical protein LFL96_05025 [Paraburkholderia sp. D15]